jgi:CheY-like chemotaxis protein
LQLGFQDPVEVDVNHLIRQLVRFRTSALDAESPQIELELQEPLPTVLGSLQQLQHVMLNLIGNAEEAARAAGKPCELSIGTTKSADQVQIWVRDNGAGLPPQVQSNVWETLVPPHGGIEWAGLGLAICQQIVQYHHGRIWSTSQADQGTTFFVELPAAGASPKPKVTVTHFPTADLPARILVIDDETSITKLLTKVLSRNGHQVDVALDGRDGLTKLQENLYDIVFLDLKIPGLPGKAIYDWIKKNQAHLLERTIVLTGDTLNKDTMGFLEQEHVEHLLKPFQLVDLQNTLQRVWHPDKG